MFSHVSRVWYINVKQHSDTEPLEEYDYDLDVCIAGFRSKSINLKSISCLIGLNNVFVNVVIELFDYKSVLYSYIMLGRLYVDRTI